MNRRKFLQASAFGLAAGLPRKKVAAVITEYRPASHADVIIGRLLDGYYYEGRRREPRIQLVSMYTDQVPHNDLSRAAAAKHGIPIFPTVREALTLGGQHLAVDGVLLIGEHGDYPLNEKGQKLYPRHRLYKQIIEVYRQSARVVPLFFDKHFSVDWDEARWMYDQYRELKFPMLAGSSAPLTWRRPRLELELETPVEKAVVVGRGPKESYGYHLLEVLQCMVERRKGGETGIAAVQCLEGAAVWKWTDTAPWAARLLDAALAAMEDRQPGSPRDNVKQPILFLLHYRSGLEAALYNLNGHVDNRSFAAQIQGRGQPVATEYPYQHGKPWAHGAGQIYFAEQMMVTGRVAYPPERTLLTTGALAALMDSTFQGARRLETPHLKIAYRAPKGSLFNRGPMPPLEAG